jgi:predicted metal-binding protein
MLINANRTLSPYINTYGKKLETYLEGKDIIDGKCHCCRKCNYPDGCLYPDKRRSSLESLGIDASRLSKEVLQHEIQWYHKKNIPKYLTVIHATLTNSNEPKTMLNY